MVEAVWELDRAYRLAANEIAAAVERMLQTDVLVVENEQEVFQRHDCTQRRTRLVRRCCHRSARHESGLFLRLDIRPEGAAASGFRVSLSRSLAVEKGPLHFEDSLRTLCKALVGQSKARRLISNQPRKTTARKIITIPPLIERDRSRVRQTACHSCLRATVGSACIALQAGM